MSISSVSSTNVLLKQLEANGLSASTASLVDKDLEAAASAAQGGATATTTSATVRAALDAKIDADVSSGKISASDAAKIKKTLDAIDGEASASGITSQGAQPAAKAAAASSGAAASHGGGGGGGGGATKTEVSETVTIAGSTMTTIITYTDDTTATTTTTATPADVAKYGSPTATGNSDNTANAYLSTINKGSLIDQSA